MGTMYIINRGFQSDFNEYFRYNISACRKDSQRYSTRDIAKYKNNLSTINVKKCFYFSKIRGVGRFPGSAPINNKFLWIHVNP